MGLSKMVVWAAELRLTGVETQQALSIVDQAPGDETSKEIFRGVVREVGKTEPPAQPRSEADARAYVTGLVSSYTTNCVSRLTQLKKNQTR